MSTNPEAQRILRRQLLEAGCILSAGVDGSRRYLTCWAPDGTDPTLLDTARATGWCVVTGYPMAWHLVKPPESHQDARKAREVG